MKLTKKDFKFHGVSKEESDRLAEKAYQQYKKDKGAVWSENHSWTNHIPWKGDDIHGEGGQFVSCWRPYAEGPLPETGPVANYIKLLEDNLLEISRESMMLKHELDSIKREK